jgi:hypothetical protein
MRITQRRLQTIIREELTRTMAHPHIQKSRPQLHESFKAGLIAAASGIPASAIDRFMPVFSGKVVTSEEAIAIANDVIKIDYDGDVDRLISDFRSAIKRGDNVAPVLRPLIPKGRSLALRPVKAVISAVETASRQELDDIFTAVKAMAKRLTGSEGTF